MFLIVYFYNDSIAHISHLTFRMFVRDHGASIASTPMIDAKGYVLSDYYRQQWTWHEHDRPLIVQFAGTESRYLIEAAEMIAEHADAIELNVGCPVPTASRHKYGAYMMDDIDNLCGIVTDMCRNIKRPVLVKTRVFREYSDTLAYAKRLEACGIHALTIHGRTRSEKRSGEKLARWHFIKQLKLDLAIPVIANGNVRTLYDAKQCLAETGADGVMSATALLHNPCLFDEKVGHTMHPIDIALKFLDFSVLYNASRQDVSRHIMAILSGRWLRKNRELREWLVDTQSVKKEKWRGGEGAPELRRLLCEADRCETDAAATAASSSNDESSPSKNADVADASNAAQKRTQRPSALQEKIDALSGGDGVCPYWLENRCRFSADECSLKHSYE